MTDQDHTPLSHLSVLRAADDMRRGLPVIVYADNAYRLVLAMERADSLTLARFDALAEASELMVTPHRAEIFKLGSKGWPVVRLTRDKDLSADEMALLADPTRDLAAPLRGPFQRSERAPDTADEAAIKLAKLARLLPAVVIADLEGPLDGLLLVEADSVLDSDMAEARTLEQVANARVPLAGAENTRLIAFRPTAGGLEHIAVVIGDPSRANPVLARLHSECFTGDLLASLKCDCGEQLRGAIESIEAEGGGVLLYMAQEGRGIGLISKLKAYALQDQGFDTVDANTRLGFDVDERVFAPAAEMLRQLGFGSVRLMTNNPGKVAALERFGVRVAERVEHAFEPNPHNHQYLEVKRDRTGHLLPERDDGS